MKGLFCYVSSLRQKAIAHFHRADPLKAVSAERRQRWAQVITAHGKPVEPQKDPEKATLPQA